MKMNWLKLSANIFDDEKIKILRKYPAGDQLLIMWIGLLCLAAKSQRLGHVELDLDIPYEPEDLGEQFGIPTRTIKFGIELMSRLRMIRLDKRGSIEITKFQDHQNLKRMELIREGNRVRQQRRRLEMQNKIDALALPAPNAVITRDSHNTNTSSRKKSVNKSKSKTKIESKSKKEIKNKEKKEKTLSPNGESGTDPLLKSRIDTIWSMLKSHNLIATSQKERDATFHALRSLAKRIAVTHDAAKFGDALDLLKRWFALLSQRNRWAVIQKDRPRQAYTELEAALELVLNPGIERTKIVLHWGATDETFWADNLFSLKSFWKINSKMGEVVSV